MTSSDQGLIAELVDWFDTWPRNAPAAAGEWGMAVRLHPYDRLFSPILINQLALRTARRNTGRISAHRGSRASQPGPDGTPQSAGHQLDEPDEVEHPPKI